MYIQYIHILYVYVYIFRKSTEAELLSLHVLTLSHNPFACLCPTTVNADALKVRNLSSKIWKVFSIWPLVHSTDVLSVSIPTARFWQTYWAADT